MSASPKWDSPSSLVDQLLAEQQDLSAVEAFSAYHDAMPADVGRYESLIPSNLPEVGEQFAFRVDLDACTGCKACVTACHNLNGLDEGETWRSVGLIEGERSPEVCSESDSPSTGFHQQTVTTACHHCEDPACLAGCPVRAYEKDSVTGIVRHLDDQCIGCRYCQLMCPYDVPTYSPRLGIVRKCDMCHSRLAEGEAPACVQGCPNEAISIGITGVRAEPSIEAKGLIDLLPGAMPESGLTRPTTRYFSKEPLGEALSPAGIRSPKPAEAHGPLAVMLVLTQASVGLLAVDGLASLAALALDASFRMTPVVVGLATLIGLTGLGASLSHLGRPQWAFRAVLGLRTSWMSREIVVLGGFAGLLVATCIFSVLAQFEVYDPPSFLRPLMHGSAIGAGFLGIYCSVQIYAVTGRPLWRFDRTAKRFLSTALWAGMAGVSVGILSGVEERTPIAGAFWIFSMVGLMVFSGVRVWRERGALLQGDGPSEYVAIERTRILLAGDLASEAGRRRWTLIFAGCVMPAVQLAGIALGFSLTLQLLLSLMILGVGLFSDVIERGLFFRSEAMPSMPGVE